MPEGNHQLRVFLCHSSADKPKVRELYSYLKRRKIDVWLDELNLLPGQDWDLEIYKATRDSDAIIICLSKESIAKEGYVQKEIRRALEISEEKPDGTIYVIPLRLEECEVPLRLKRYHWVDLFAEGGNEKLMKALRVRAEQLERISVEIPASSQTASINAGETEKSQGATSILEKHVSAEKKEPARGEKSFKWGNVIPAFSLFFALFVLLFGNNIYQQITGRSFFASTTPTLSATPTSIVTSTPSPTPTLTPTFTRTSTPTDTFTPSTTPTPVATSTITPSRTPLPTWTKTPLPAPENIGVTAPPSGMQVICPFGETCSVSVSYNWFNSIPGNRVCIFVRSLETIGQKYFYQAVANTAYIGPTAVDMVTFEIHVISTAQGCGDAFTLPSGNSDMVQVVRVHPTPTP